MLSAHTSPLDSPGVGDAGGMNVYVRQLAKELVQRSIEVDIFTRATSSEQAESLEAPEGFRVHHVGAGPFEKLPKEHFSAQMCAFVRDVLRHTIASPFDVLHSHYWLSGQIGSVVKERWDTPLVHTMHTMAKVKNASRAEGDVIEPLARIRGEEDLVGHADRLIANTVDEAHDLVELYQARPAAISVVNPGVDLEIFKPGDQTLARLALGLPREACIIVYAGRIQPLKAPDVLIQAVRLMQESCAEKFSEIVLVIAGGASGPQDDYVDRLRQSAAVLGSSIRFVPTLAQEDLSSWFRAADLVCVPSFNESFGLVALEAQACGTPVVAARVGGLSTAVNDGVTGILVDSHHPRDFATALAALMANTELRSSMREKAIAHASGFSWSATADATLAAYEIARFERQKL